MRLKTSLIAVCALIGAPSLAQAQSGIEVQELGAVNPFEVGTVEALPADVWMNSTPLSLQTALEALPTGQGEGFNSGLAARLASRALLSAGEPPRGADFRLAAQRADRALATGRPAPVFELLTRTPRVNESAELSQVYSETAFALGYFDQACRAADALLVERDAPYWLRARAACLALRGNIPAAELTAELARANANGEADEFFTVFDAFTLGADIPAGLTPHDGASLALMQERHPDRVIAVDETASAWLHEAALRTGPEIRLPQDPMAALEAARSLAGPERAAALGALVHQDYDRLIAAEALATRLNDAKVEGDFIGVARTYGPEVSSLPMTEETLAHGRLFILSAVLAEDIETAEIWREALEYGPPRPEPAPMPEFETDPTTGGQSTAGQGGPAQLSPGAQDLALPQVPEWQAPAARILVALDFVLAIADRDIYSDGFEALHSARIETANRQRLAQGVALLSMGARAPMELRDHLVSYQRNRVPAPQLGEGEAQGEGDAPSPALDVETLTGYGLLAAQAGARGEAQIFAAALIEADAHNPFVLANAISILMRAGLEDEAHRLVLEKVIEDEA